MPRLSLLALLLTSACFLDQRDDTSGNQPPIGGDDTGRAGDTGILDPNAQSPIAVCNADRLVVDPPYQTTRVDAVGTYSPDGIEIIGYEWSLMEAPDGNGAALSARTGMETSLTPQIAGDYRIELIAYDARGLRSEEPCVTTLRAIPVSSVHVELFWSHRNEDMDLHLLRPGGTLRTADDCWVDNCEDGLDWQTDNASTTVQLLASSTQAVGPEIIRLDSDEDGEFTVYVHDNPGAERIEPTDVTVNIRVNGATVLNETRSISGEDTDTVFATVNPVTGVVTPLGANE